MEDIEPKNTKGEYHGYQEWYDYYGNKLWLRVNRINGNSIGYCEINQECRHGIGDDGTLVNFYIR